MGKHMVLNLIMDEPMYLSSRLRVWMNVSTACYDEPQKRSMSNGPHLASSDLKIVLLRNQLLGSRDCLDSMSTQTFSHPGM